MTTMDYKQATILLVEDDDVDAMSVKRAFKKLKIGNPIIRAKDGIVALDMLKENSISKPFLILLDLNMPRMGGLEFLAELRNDEYLKNSVVFVLTTSKDDEDKFAAYAKNIAGYVLKERLQHGFDELVKLLDHYWRIVELPDK